MENSVNLPEQSEQPQSSASLGRTSTVKFFGKTGEYYAIWIVNLLLSIVTLGIYSAWAKVRTLRYFYGSTEVDGHRFSYLATPIQILKGRIIAVIIFAAFYFVSAMSPMFAGVLILIYLFAAPWLLCKSLQFNMKMTSYRNIRFNFHGKYLKALLVFVVYPILSLFTLYLALPLALKAIDRFICENISYAGKPFTTKITAGTYYLASLGAMLAASAVMIIALPLAGINFENLAAAPAEISITTQAIFMLAYVLVFVVSGAVYKQVVRNHLFDNTAIEDVVKFKSNVGLASLIWLNFSNLIALICTLGFALPWVKIRQSQYFCDVTDVTVLSGADNAIAEVTHGEDALGDEVSELFDLDIAIT